MQILKKSDDGVALVASETGMRHEHFECICDTEEHAMRVTYFVDEWDGIEEDEVYISLYMTGKGFWARLWHGLKYIFGHKSRYGDYQCITIKREDAERLRDLMNRYIESGLVSVSKERSVRIVEQGPGYVITNTGIKVHLLADAELHDYDKGNS